MDKSDTCPLNGQRHVGNLFYELNQSVHALAAGEVLEQLADINVAALRASQSRQEAVLKIGGTDVILREQNVQQRARRRSS